MINVGDKFYIFDDNRRIYKRDENGRSSGSPIFREKFVQVEIVGETSRSWVFSYYGETKVSKKDPWKKIHTLKMVNDKVWLKEHAYKLGEKVQQCRDIAKMKQIAVIVGLDTPTPTC